MKLFQREMKEEKEKTFEEIVEDFIESQGRDVFVVQDLHKAVIAGCNEMTTRQHDNAVVYADEYVSMKHKDLVYTASDVEKAFRYGARRMAEFVDSQKIVLTKEKLQKASKLICAGSQLMLMADNFNKEAEKLLSIDGIKETVITNKWLEIAKLFKELHEDSMKVFMSLTPDESYDWGDESEKLEYAVRKIMKIDRYENFNKKKR